MKHIKLYENFDFNEDDFDFEEEGPVEWIEAINKNILKEGTKVKLNPKYEVVHNKDYNEYLIGYVKEYVSDYDFPYRVKWDGSYEDWYQYKELLYNPSLNENFDFNEDDFDFEEEDVFIHDENLKKLNKKRKTYRRKKRISK